MRLPPDHPLRTELNDEVHARPPDALAAPVCVWYLALVSDGAGREREREESAPIRGDVSASYVPARDSGPPIVELRRGANFPL